MASPVCVVILGPKAVGKSWVGMVLSSKLGVPHLDTDALILDLLERGYAPDRDHGWLDQVQGAVIDALALNHVVSVEATGAWDSDWMLIDRLRQHGITVHTVWIQASLDQSLERLRNRSGRKVPTTETEARRLYAETTRRAAATSFDLVVDTSTTPNEESVASQLRPLLED